MANENGILLIYTTFPGPEEARRIGAHLVKEKLAACVNIFPGMISIFEWEGKTDESSEAAMLIKTRDEHKAAVFEAVARLHPYTVPAIIAFTPESVAEPYRCWLLEQTAS